MGRSLKVAGLLAGLLVLGTAREAGAQVAAEGAGPVVEFALPTTAAASRSVSQYRGRVVVIFYENRDAISQNQALKDAIGRVGAQDPTLAQRFALVAVANLAEFAFWPAEYFAREAITRVARHAHVELWLDWHHVLFRRLGLRDGVSNVVVLDREGRVRLRRSGAIPASQVQPFLRALAAIAGAG
jgi:predicted transcriptional regulator